MSKCDSFRLPTYDELSREQDSVLNFPLDGSYLVTGPPGSGKTVLAIYRAKALADRASEGSVILMFNKLLSRYTTAAVDSLGVDSLVDNYHHWFPEWYRDTYSALPPRINAHEFDWDDILLKMIATGSVPANHELHVVVDEGQDMPPAFYSIMSMISGKHGLLVFADENQAITEHQSTIASILTAASIPEQFNLSYNYRNTAEIAAVAASFHAGVATGVAELPDAYRTGDRPQLIRDDSFNGFVDRLLNLETTYSDRCIGIFYPKKWQVKSLYKRLEGRTRNPVGAYVSGMKNWERSEIGFDQPGISITTFKSAKGLQFDIVLVPGLQLMDWPKPGSREFQMEMYVVSTRAREQLIFSYEGQQRSNAISQLPVDLLDDRT